MLTLRISKSQTRIRPGFKAKSHEQEQSQEPDANQARILRQEPPARARRASGQDWQPRATGKSQTRIRPGFAGKSYRQEPDTHQARIRDRQPGTRFSGKSGNAGVAVGRRSGGARGRSARAERARRLEKTIPDTQGSGKTNFS